MNRFGEIATPIIFENTNGFYTELLQWLDKTIEQKFMRKKHQKVWKVIDNIA